MAGPIRVHLAENLSVDAQELITGRTCVIAQSGAGKSYLIAVLCEKLLREGLGFCIIDTEGEYFSLKEKFKLLWIGGEEADVNLQVVNLRSLAEKMLTTNIPVIFDVSDAPQESKAVADFCQALYEKATQLKRPYLLIIEEADKFAPQSLRDEVSLHAVEEIARRGRKRGLGLLIATQRPAFINKNVLSQCANQFIGRLTIENDLDAVNLFFASRRELEEIPKLQQGEFFAMGNIAQEKLRFRSFARETKHRGLTPKLVRTPVGELPGIEDIIEIRKPAPQPPKELKPPKTSRLVPAVPALLTAEEAQQRLEAKKGRRFLLFGKPDSLLSVELLYHPVFYVEARRRKGVLRKKPVINAFCIDGRKGHLVDIEHGFSLRRGIGDFVGLTATDSAVLLALKDRQGMSLAEIEQQTGIGSRSLGPVMKKLQARKLVMAKKIGTQNHYIPVRQFSRPDLDLNTLNPAQRLDVAGKVSKPALTAKDIERTLLSIEDQWEVRKIELFYYPLYRAELMGRDRREMWLDAVTGKEINDL